MRTAPGRGLFSSLSHFVIPPQILAALISHNYVNAHPLAPGTVDRGGGWLRGAGPAALAGTAQRLAGHHAIWDDERAQVSGQRSNSGPCQEEQHGALRSEVVRRSISRCTAGATKTAIPTPPSPPSWAALRCVWRRARASSIPAQLWSHEYWPAHTSRTPINPTHARPKDIPTVPKPHTQGLPSSSTRSRILTASTTSTRRAHFRRSSSHC